MGLIFPRRHAGGRIIGVRIASASNRLRRLYIRCLEFVIGCAFGVNVNDDRCLRWIEHGVPELELTLPEGLGANLGK